ncbi:hypothetical protein D3C87_996140 [compost metagenome]
MELFIAKRHLRSKFSSRQACSHGLTGTLKYFPACSPHFGTLCLRHQKTGGSMRFLLGSLLLLGFASSQAAQITKTTFAFPGRVEIHVQPELAELDVLFVIDDSASMTDHQRNLSGNIPNLVKAVMGQGVHIHAGVTTTTPVQDCYGNACGGKFNGPMLDSKNADFISRLNESLNVGTRGSANEMPLDTAVAALSDAAALADHPDFYRSRAHLALIFLTDADDQSVNHTPEKFAAFFKGLKSNSQQLSVHSIQAMKAFECQSEDFGPVLTTAVGLLNGKMYNICSPDYGTQLGNIGADLSRKVTREIPLTTIPDVPSIVVAYGSTVLEKGDLHHGWVYNSVTNMVVLGDMIDWSALKGDELVVSFIPKDWK